jgi:hypothetical protein
LTICFGRALLDFEAMGVMALTTKWRAGDLFARLFALQEVAIGKFDFEAIMYAQGKAAIARRFRAMACRQGCADLKPATLDAMHAEAIGWIGGILAKVTAEERARAN